MRYRVEVPFTVSQLFEVEAATPDDAVQAVREGNGTLLFPAEINGEDALPPDHWRVEAAEVDPPVVDDRPAVVCSVCTCDTPRESASQRNGEWVCEDCLFMEAVREEEA
jgi:formylmethanofuran dehydrogenase subunit E